MIFSNRTAIVLSTSLALLAFARCGTRPETVSADSEEASTFRVLEVSAKTTPEGWSTESFGFPRAQIFNFSTCVIDTAANRPVVGEAFEVHAGQSVFQVTSNTQGCINWAEERGYDFFQKEAYLPEEQRTFVGKGAHIGTQHALLTLNPWNAYVPVIDLRFRQKPIGSASASSSSSAQPGEVSNTSLGQLMINGAAITYVQHEYDSYKVGPFMDLTMVNRYQIQLSPYFLRQSLDGVASEDLWYGKMRLIVALFRGQQGDPLDETTFITSNVLDENSLVAIQKSEVSWDTKSLTHQFTLQFPRIPDVGTTNRIFIGLYPVSSGNPFLGKAEVASGLRPGVFEGRLSPLTDGTSSPALHKTNINLIDVVSAIRPQGAGSSQPCYDTPINTYRASGKVQPLSFKDVATPELPKEAWLAFMNGDTSNSKKIVKALCEKLYPSRSGPAAVQAYAHLITRAWDLAKDVVDKEHPQTALETDQEFCERMPQRAIQIYTQDFVQKIYNNNHPTGHQASRPVPFGMSISITNGHDRSTSNSYSTGASVSAGADLFKVSGIGVGASASGSFSHSVGLSSSSGSSVTLSASYPAVASQVTFDFLVDARRCLLVQSREASKFKPVQLCDDKVERKSIQESYVDVSITASTDRSAFVDTNNEPKDMALFLRGRKTFDAFLEVFDKQRAVFLPDMDGHVNSVSTLLKTPLANPADNGIPGAVEVEVPLENL